MNEVPLDDADGGSSFFPPAPVPGRFFGGEGEDFLGTPGGKFLRITPSVFWKTEPGSSLNRSGVDIAAIAKLVSEAEATPGLRNTFRDKEGGGLGAKY